MPGLAGYDPNPSDNLSVEIAFTTTPDDPAPAWVDVTDRLDLSTSVSITRGRNDEHSAVQPSTMSLTLDNADGELTAGNAGSSFYPNVLPHRKIRVSYRNVDVPVNLLSESAASMEAGVSDWFSNTAFGFLDVATLAGSALHPHHGTNGGRATWPTTALGSMAMTNATGLTIGRTYTASCYVWVPAGSPDVFMDCLLVTGGTATATKDALTRISVTFTATSTSHVIGPRVASATAGQLCYWDSVQVDEGTEVREFTLTAPEVEYRFTGYVDEWPCEWPNGGAYSQATITATDRLARIGAKRTMRSVIEEAILAADPFCYWPLGEPEESTLAGDSTGTPGVSILTIQQVGTGGTLEFGTATGPPTDALPAPTFTPVNVTNGKHLLGSVPNNGIEGALGFFPVTTFGTFLTSAAVDQTILRRVDLYGSYVDVSTNAAGNVVVTEWDSWSASTKVTVTSPLTYKDGATHSFAVTQAVSGSTLTTTLYIDGASVASGTHTATVTQLSSFVRIGGASTGRQFNGVITHIAGFVGALTAAQIAELHTATTTGFEGDTSDERIQRYARWAGIPDAEMDLDAGSSTSICFTDTTGQSILQAMQDVATTEGGRLFIDGAGTLVFHARSRSYDNPAATAEVDAGLLGPDARFSLSTQGLINDMTGQRPAGPTIRAFDADSIETYGVFSQSTTLLVTSDTEVADAVNWRVQGNATPLVRLPQGAFDLYTDDTGYQAQLRALDLGNRVTVTGLPDQAPASTVDLVVEGYTESISITDWTLTANLSNYSSVQALVLDDDVYGLMDGDNRLIY